MEFLLNPSLGPGTMPLLPTFFCFMQNWSSFLVSHWELLKCLEFTLFANDKTQMEGALGSFRMGIGHQKNQPCEYRV